MIIVTGGAGFIGSNIVASLIEQGHKDIVVCDWMGQDDKWKNLRKHLLRDIIAPEQLFEFLADNKNVETIFHMGAISTTTEKDVDLIVRSNIEMSIKLWDWCTQHDKRFIYASSAATYGDGAHGFVDNADPTHLSKLLPLNPYGWSKHFFDRWVTARTLDDKDNTPRQYVGLKFFNVYGPNEYHKQGQMSVVCGLYPKIMNGQLAQLFKSYHADYVDGGQSRDFVYVKDCVEVMLHFLQNPNHNGLFNVGTGQARSFLDLAKATFHAANIKENIEFIDMPEQLRDKYQNFTQADLTKLRAIGYAKAFTTLEDGIADYVQNYMSKKDDPYR